MIKFSTSRDKSKYIDTYGYFSASELKHLIINGMDTNSFKSVLEIGSYEGVFTTFAADNFAETVHTVDPFLETDPGTRLNYKTETNFLINLSRCTNLSRIYFHKMKSDEFFDRNKLMFDFIYIDGSHEPRDCIADLDMSLEFITPNGVIWIDDYGSDYKSLHASINLWVAKNVFRIEIIHKGYQLGIKLKT
jgi:hypothetical protein